jgi:hypothetical protein
LSKTYDENHCGTGEDERQSRRQRFIHAYQAVASDERGVHQQTIGSAGVLLLWRGSRLPSAPDFVEKEHCRPVLLLFVEAVAQTLGSMLVGGAGGSAVGDVPEVCGGVTAGGPVSGCHGGELVAVNLGEGVGHHQ